MQLCMASGINIYSFFSDNRNSYSRYLKKNYFGYPKPGTYFRYQKSYFRYQKQLRISENKHLFQISKIVIMDIEINVYFQISEIVISDIQNSYFGYPKNIPDIRNYAKKAFYLRYPKKLFWISKITISVGYPKINIYFGYQKLLFWISEIVISDIWNSFFRYLKLMCQYFRYHKFFLSDIQNNFFGYLKKTNRC